MCIVVASHRLQEVAVAWSEARKKREFSGHLCKLINNRLATDPDFLVCGVAGKSGLPKQTIADFQVGRSMPTLEQLKVLALAFDLSLEEFLPGELGSEILLTENSDPISFELTEIKGTETGWLWVDKPVPMSIGLKVLALLSTGDPEM